MIRQNRDGTFQVDCSHCKSSAGVTSGLSEAALERAEQAKGYAVCGKFHFCPSCFSDMMERWKLNNSKEASVG